MPERLHKTSDVPNFDTYQAEPPLPEKRSRSDGNTALEQTARQVGATMGKAVATMHKAQERMKDIAADTTEAATTQIEEVKNKAQQATARISEMTDAVKARAQEWSEAAVARAEELRSATLEKASQLGSSVKMGYYRTRMRANRVVREYPLQVVLVAGALGFLVGVGLRIWRANRES